MEALLKMLDFRVMALLYAGLSLAVLLGLGIVAMALRALEAVKTFLKPAYGHSREHSAPLPKTI